MPMPKHVLLAVDDSPASARVAEYVGSILRINEHGRRQGDAAKVTIFHCYPEHHENHYATGAALAPDIKRPAYEYQLERSHDVAVHLVECRRPTDEAREQLVEAGVPRSAISVHHVACGPSADVAARIVKTARQLECDTIAVGRNRDRRLLRSHISDAVIKKTENIAVWVVH